MGFEASAGGTPPGFLDESPTAKGSCPTILNVSIDTTVFKWGISSLKNAAVGGISWNPSTDWDFGNSPFTVECWVQFISTTNQQQFFGIWSGSDKYWNFSKTATGQLSWHITTDGFTDIAVVDAAWGPTTGVWYHVAVDWDGIKTRAYANGVMLGSDSTSRTIAASQPGGFPLGVTGYFVFPANVFLDELRITKSVARYATDTSFPVPTAAFPRHA
jgi:hypothetical protein